MSYVSDKIAEARARGHFIPNVIEELLAAIADKIGLEAPKAGSKKDPGDELNR